MDLINKLNLKNIPFEFYSNEGKHLRSQWKDTFANNLSKEEKRKIYIVQFLWHIFSYKKIEHLEKEEARQAFNSILKDECYVFYQNSDEVLKLNKAENIKAEDFDSDNDIYVINKKMSWTYVHTHEEYCGPYFCRLNNIKSY